MFFMRIAINIQWIPSPPNSEQNFLKVKKFCGNAYTGFMLLYFAYILFIFFLQVYNYVFHESNVADPVAGTYRTLW